MNSKKKLFIVAGEASGDTIGANLVRELHTGDCIIKGVGGDLMEKAGCEILFHYDKIAVLGLVEIIFSYPRLKQYMQKTIEAIVEFQPDVIVTIDAPGFNFRLIKTLKKKFKFTAIHYVAPTVWAYGSNRIKIVEKLFDHILLILPFESEYFRNMPHTFVGHPIVEDNSCLLHNTKDVIKKDNLKLQSQDWNISIMVGSRRCEIKRHTQTIMMWINIMKDLDHKDIQFHFLILPHLEQFLHDEISIHTSSFDKIHINSDTALHDKIIKESVLGIVKSGTTTMRFMANATPAITFYKVSKITAWIMKLRLKIDKFNLCNIITNSYTLPELMQDNFNAYNMLAKSEELLKTSRSNIINCYLQTWNMLKQDVSPSKKAAEIVKKYLYEKNNNQ